VEIAISSPPFLHATVLSHFSVEPTITPHSWPVAPCGCIGRNYETITPAKT